jgi:Flp pilus assembly protein CpaB
MNHTPEGGIDRDEEQDTNLGEHIVLRVAESEEAKTWNVSTSLATNSCALRRLTDQDQKDDGLADTRVKSLCVSHLSAISSPLPRSLFETLVNNSPVPTTIS